MIVLGLITCIVLRALTAQAKVDNNFDECKQFFYQGIAPSVGDYGKGICQKLENRVYYATLYSDYYRIPLYSAYTLDPYCSCDTGRSNIWHLEPQISQPRSPFDHMVRDNAYNRYLYRENQAISTDYRGSGYDRGHLNPNFFQCNEGRIATFTLTNAAPMNRDFNRQHWYYWERTLRDYLSEKLARDRYYATAFIVTGTVPDPTEWIPRWRTYEYKYRVSVPSHIWTAVCYKHHTDDRKSFSFGYIGENNNIEPNIRLMSVGALHGELHNFWPRRSIQIFADHCFGVKNKLNEVKNVFQNKQKDQSATYEYDYSTSYDHNDEWEYCSVD